jgi:radical SAM superfamily enzyme YgiQ (UPF0313 family)
MKIVLTTLPREGEFVHWATSLKIAPLSVKHIPLGLLSLASNIKGNHEVVIFDPPLRGLSIDETIEKIQSLNPDVVGITAVTRRTYALRQMLKKLKVPYIAVGGPHASYYADTILKWGANSVFIGNLADQEFNDAINGKLPIGVVKCNTDINSIKFPNRNLINIKDYIFEGKVLFTAKNRLPMFSSIGCPNRCTFCNVQSKKVIFKNASIIIQEMLHLKSLGCGSVHILDDNFNISNTHVESILHELEKVKWNMEWSARCQVNMNFDFVPRLAVTGFKRIHVGFESFIPDILKSFRKAQNIELMSKFCETMNTNNIEILAYLVIGSPLETNEHRKILTDKIKEFNIKYPFFNVLFPEPNTEYYSSLLKDGFYKEDLWAKFMQNPVPDYEIPYPYGETKKQEVLGFSDEMIERFR